MCESAALPTFSTQFLITESEVHCHECCSPREILSCCDICDPNWTKAMLAIDAPPKTKQKPNKVKIDENHPLMDLDKRLRHELDAFQEKIHAEIWGDVMDFLFGSHVFLTMPQILHLCHLAHANALHTLEDLKNNFWWNWMPDYGHTLLKLIHHIYDFKPSTTISPNDEIGTSNSPLNSS